jgi:hypothetical protein
VDPSLPTCNTQVDLDPGERKARVDWNHKADVALKFPFVDKLPIDRGPRPDINHIIRRGSQTCDRSIIDKPYFPWWPNWKAGWSPGDSRHQFGRSLPLGDAPFPPSVKRKLLPNARFSSSAQDIETDIKPRRLNSL